MAHKSTVYCMLLCLGTLFVAAPAATAQSPNPAPDGRVLASRVVELKSETDRSEFEEFVRGEFSAAFEKPVAGVRFYVLKGDRGINTGKYLLVWEFPSLELRNKCYPKEGAPEQMWFVIAMKPVWGVMTRLTGYLRPFTDYTDYVAITR